MGDLHLEWDLALGNGELGGLAVDARGNVTLTGTYLDSLNVGGKTLRPASGAAGDSHPFVAMLDSGGGLRWGRTFPGNWQPAGVALDGAGNIYLAGPSGDPTVDLGKGPLPGSLIVAKLGPTGSTIWSKSFEAFRNPTGWLISKLAIAADPAGNVAVNGTAIVPVDFGGGAPPPSASGFLAVFDTDGDYRFSKSYGSSGADAAVAFDESGNLLFGGGLYGTLDLGGLVLNAGDAGSGFAALLDSTGNPSWGNAFGAGTRVSALATRAGASFVAGKFNQELAVPGTTTATSGLEDLFLFATDQRGGTTKLTTIAAAADQVGALAAAADGGTLALVEVGDVVDFGTGSISRPGLALLRADSGGRTVASAAFHAPNGAVAGAVTEDPTGGIVVYGSFARALDLGAGLLTGADSWAQTLFVARFTQRPPALAGHSVPCPPLEEGALASGPSGAGQPKALLLHGATLYYSTGTEVMSVPVAGGPATVLAKGQRNVVALASDDERLYWAAAGHDAYLALPADGEIVSMPLGGGASTVLASAQRAPSAIAIDGDNVYWAAGGVPTDGMGTPMPDGKIWALPKTEGARAAILADNLDTPGPVAASSGSVVFAARTSSGFPAVSSEVYAVARAGGTPIPLAATDRWVSSIATDGTSIFWTDASSLTVDTSLNDGRLRAVPLTGGTASVLADSQPSPGDLALIGDQVYWANQGGFNNAASEHNAGIWRVSKTGNDAGAIIGHLAAVTTFAADATHLAYVEWVDPASDYEHWALRVGSP